jgi:hypothetical protein
MRFLIKLTILSFITATVILFFQMQTHLLADSSEFIWASWLFITCLTGGSFYLLQKGLKLKGHTQFMQYFGAMLGCKVFMSLLFVSYFIYVKPLSNKHFVLVFFALYSLFTALLVSEAWQKLKEKN